MASHMRVIQSAVAAVAVGILSNAYSQSFPTKPITILSATAPGSGGDIALRLVASKMAASLGQPVVVEVRTGAGGALAAQAVQRATPDGHTLLYGNTGSFVFPRFLMKNVPFDAIKDFVPISLLITAPTHVTVHSSIPVESLSELIEYAKKNPGKLTYASTGIGSSFHLMGEALQIRTGTKLLHVPYSQKQFQQLLTDFVEGRINVYFPSYAALAPYLSSGKLKVLATLDRKRNSFFPDIPTIDELLPGFKKPESWWGFFGPLGLPRATVDRLSVEVQKAVSDRIVASKLEDLALGIVASSPDELGATLRSDIESVGELVKKLGIQPQ